VRNISQNVIARNKVLYDGHALAAVAASSPHIAEEALRLIEVDYEVLQPVMTLDDAMKPDAPVVFSGRGQDGSPNIADHLQIERGDIDAGFKAVDYRMPTCLDLPMIETIVVEVPNPDHPLGTRGVGEIAIVPPMAAVANAIYHAVGVRMTELPMSPPRLLKAMLTKSAAIDSQTAAAD